MNKINRISLIIIFLVFSFSYFSCDSSDTVENETGLSKDTVIFKYDTVFVKREGQPKPVRFDITIQLGSYQVKSNAELFAEKVKGLLEKEVNIINVRGKYIVIVGKYTEPDAANSYLQEVKSKGIKDAYVRNIKDIY
jgi:hypothetical protein